MVHVKIKTIVLDVGILGAVGREGRNSRLSHYHETSGLAQTREELVYTTLYIYEILHCHTETRVPHREALAPNIQILNIGVCVHGYSTMWLSGHQKNPFQGLKSFDREWGTGATIL